MFKFLTTFEILEHLNEVEKAEAEIKGMVLECSGNNENGRITAAKKLVEEKKRNSGLGKTLLFGSRLDRLEYAMKQLLIKHEIGEDIANQVHNILSGQEEIEGF